MNCDAIDEGNSKLKEAVSLTEIMNEARLPRYLEHCRETCITWFDEAKNLRERLTNEYQKTEALLVTEDDCWQFLEATPPVATATLTEGDLEKVFRYFKTLLQNGSYVLDGGRDEACKMLQDLQHSHRGLHGLEDSIKSGVDFFESVLEVEPIDKALGEASEATMEKLKELHQLISEEQNAEVDGEINLINDMFEAVVQTMKQLMSLADEKSRIIEIVASNHERYFGPSWTTLRSICSSTLHTKRRIEVNRKARYKQLTDLHKHIQEEERSDRDSEENYVCFNTNFTLQLDRIEGELLSNGEKMYRGRYGTDLDVWEGTQHELVKQRSDLIKSFVKNVETRSNVDSRFCQFLTAATVCKTRLEADIGTTQQILESIGKLETLFIFVLRKCYVHLSSVRSLTHDLRVKALKEQFAYRRRLYLIFTYRNHRKTMQETVLKDELRYHAMQQELATDRMDPSAKHHSIEYSRLRDMFETVQKELQTIAPELSSLDESCTQLIQELAGHGVFPLHPIDEGAEIVLSMRQRTLDNRAYLAVTDQERIQTEREAIKNIVTCRKKQKDGPL